MVDEAASVIYDATPIWAKIAGWILLGVGGFVLVPISLIRGDYWLLYFALPLLVAGLVLMAVRLRIAAIPQASVLRVSNSFLGLQLRQSQYLRSDVSALDVHRVAAVDEERDSDTWYLRMHLANRHYTIGKYDTRMAALVARREVEEALDTLPLAPAGEETNVHEEQREDRRGETARAHYKDGIELFRAGDKEGARAEFEKALVFAQEPLLQRMIEQRLEELDRR